MNITPCPKKISIKDCLRVAKHLSSDKVFRFYNDVFVSHKE
jgi:transcription termination factor NusB